MQTPPVNYIELVRKIKVWGSALGFQSVGISNIDLAEAECRLLDWLAQGFHGNMEYMAKHGTKRSRPAELLPGTMCVLTARMNYLPANAKLPSDVLLDGNRAYISRYALGRDYHKVLRKRLESLAEKIRSEVETCNCRVFTDSAPVMEVELGHKSQLGWRGKHNLLLSRDSGSWFFLGEIYLDLALPTEKHASENHCGSCTRCMEACPTQAIVAPYQLDARKCISYLTIENKGSIPNEFRSLIGNRIYGCDDCQLFCPWNRFASSTDEQDFAVRHNLDDVDLVELFGWSESRFKAKFAGSAIYRIGYEQWLRNIAVALGNTPKSERVINALNSRSKHHSLLVREHVAWALDMHSNTCL